MYSSKVSKYKDNKQVVHFSINGLSKAIGLDNQLDQNDPLEDPCSPLEDLVLTDIPSTYKIANSPLEIRGSLFSFMRTILVKDSGKVSILTTHK